MSERCVDADGREIVVGTRVKVAEFDDVGFVTSISDPDGDCNDEGRAFGIAPKVAVEWQDGSVEEFGTEYAGSGFRDDDPWQCEDLVVVGAE